jgi:hypothetical protein
MIRKLAKTAALTICATVSIFFVLFVALLTDWGRSSAHKEQDRLILQTQSPDGKLVAEVHTFTTGMWGWPDTLYVALRESENPFGDKVYARTYE